MDLGSDRAPNLESDGEIDADTHPDEVELPGPKPTMDQDPEAFKVVSAAKPGPLPPDVERELRQLADAIQATVEDPEGVVATRFGRRVVVAPVDNVDDHVDIADVDLTRKLVLTFGGEDPTPEGSLIAQVLFQRREVPHGFARAPDTDGPTLSVLQQVLPALRGTQAVDVDGIGTLAVGHQPSALAGAVASVDAAEDADVNEADEDGSPGPSPGSVNEI